MRLYLSSYKWGDEPEKLLELLGDEPKRVALIMNAKDAYDETVIIDKTQLDLSVWDGLGLETERLDLRDYFGKPETLRTELKKFGLLWVFGGNSFVLRRAMQYSGFDKIITEMLQKDEIVYGGFSAGACVMTPTLRGIELCDDPNVVPEGYESEIIWDGLNVVPYSIAPHYKSDHPESPLIDRIVEYFEHHKMPYKTLHDGEVMIVDGA